MDKKSEILIYQTEDGQTKVDVTYADETVWLALDQMAELFQRDNSTISRHIKNIFQEGELEPGSVIAKYATTAADGKTYQVEYYNLDVIISVGYRVKSHRGIQFRKWASGVLKEYMRKGFAMNDDLLKKAGGGNYFKELLERIRDIRSSEKVFYRQVLDIYATSIDYDAGTKTTQTFFQAVQNKMHWAAHGHTAPELIVARVDADKPFMGMTAFAGGRPSKQDAMTAKNYLGEAEVNMLNAIVSAYLEFAEMQAKSQKPMYMRDWIAKLDEFLKMSDKEILTTGGRITREEAARIAGAEYEKYRAKNKNELTPVERDFLETVKRTQKLLSGKK